MASEGSTHFGPSLSPEVNGEFKVEAENHSPHATHRPPAIEIRKAVKRFGERVAVDELSLTVGMGEVFGFLGPNGSGKTTTVNLITGLTHLTSGEIHVLGQDVARHGARIRARLGAVPQETALYEELTALHNLQLHADLYFVPREVRERRIDMVLDLMQLSDRRDSRVGTFSGGMKRRLALGRALLHNPELIILDEPTLGVDVQSRRALWDRIVGLRERGRAILLTTNYLEEADALCDRIAIIDHGRIVALDTPQALRGRFGTSSIDFMTRNPATERVLTGLRSMAGVVAVQSNSHSLKVTIDGRPKTSGEVVTAVAHTCGIASIEQNSPTLDAVFLQLTGRDLRDTEGGS
jgi:ABC-2 type transport system ATP-binding protein